MRRTTVGAARYLKIGIVAVVALSLIVAGFLIMKNWEDSQGRFPEQETIPPVVEHNGVKYVLQKNVETFLVIGLDKFDGDSGEDSYNNDKVADFLMLFVINNDTKQYSAIHINRDTIADVNILGLAGNKVDTVKAQIALSHTYGNGRDLSCHNTADSVSSLLKGVKVNHYASLTMDAVAVVNDMVGGVEVEVLDDFSGIDDSLIKGERVTLMGEQALTYVRARQGLEDSSNASRMKRQQQYVNGLYDAFMKCAEQDDEFVVEATLKLADYLVSDRSANQLQVLNDKFIDYEFVGIEDIAGESVVGEQFMEFYPDEDQLTELVIKLFYTPKK